MIKNIVKNLSNSIGWKTNRKIIVIESDDWGSIRMPSINSFNRLTEKGLSLSYGDALRYNQNDTLADESDLNALFETLYKIKDSKNNALVFTPITIVANPNFEKIRNDKFQNYHFEPFTETLDKYYNRNSIFKFWQDGIKNHLFVPQFHGREHLNVAVWMKALQENDSQTQMAFDEGCWGFKNTNQHHIRYQAAFDLDNPKELEGQHHILESGLKLFEDLFGYKATFFVPPNGPFNNKLEKTAAENGIKFMSSSKIQLEAVGNGRTRKRYHYLGQKNKQNQIYLTRNCFFEPSDKTKNWVTSCLDEIDIAFRWKKPAVISSHRVNYIGVLNDENRKNGLIELEELIKKVIEKHPTIEFMTSAELGNLISKKE